jgi:HEPN domain-containing protein
MTSFDATEYGRWLAQAEHTIASARRDAEAGDYAWSCFPEGSPHEYYNRPAAEGAVSAADQIIVWVQSAS